MAHEEYLRRNRLHMKSIGAKANAQSALDRLHSRQTAAPQWLIRALEDLRDRAETLSPDLARWRDAAPDSPKGATTAPDRANG